METPATAFLRFLSTSTAPYTPFPVPGAGEEGVGWFAYDLCGDSLAEWIPTHFLACLPQVHSFRPI